MNARELVGKIGHTTVYIETFSTPDDVRVVVEHSMQPHEAPAVAVLVRVAGKLILARAKERRANARRQGARV